MRRAAGNPKDQGADRDGAGDPDDDGDCGLLVGIGLGPVGAGRRGRRHRRHGRGCLGLGGSRNGRGRRWERLSAGLAEPGAIGVLLAALRAEHGAPIVVFGEGVVPVPVPVRLYDAHMLALASCGLCRAPGVFAGRFESLCIDYAGGFWNGSSCRLRSPEMQRYLEIPLYMTPREPIEPPTDNSFLGFLECIALQSPWKPT